MRVKTPWIEALRKQRKQGSDPITTSDTSAKAPERDLRPKKMSESYHRVVRNLTGKIPCLTELTPTLIIPLAQDPWLLDNYLNANGHIRLGTIFMDLDALSGVIAYKHTGETVTTVTAAVDRITINHPLKELCDLELSGQVTFATGRSSMEISLQVAKAPKNDEKTRKEDILMTCAFTMVSLDPSSKKPVSISPLQVETTEEKRLFALGEKNYNAKKELAKTNLRKQAPNDLESDLIHAMWLKELDRRSHNRSTQQATNTVYMDKSRLHTTQIMQPQYRNRHNFMIFGGFLLKQTFELAFCCAASFTRSRPTFLSLDPSTFANPVPVGSVLYLTAVAAYADHPPASVENNTNQPPNGHEHGSGGSGSDLHTKSKYTRVQIRIDSRVRNIEHGEAKPTGQFNYTFLVEKDIKVVPRTYSEFMIWIDARRRAERVSASMICAENADGAGHAQDDGKRDRITE
ncbi:hypothetical protein MMC29_006320 [Sticta canariensis]|nr:hypothetical protein [Sticta canariensis]